VRDVPRREGDAARAGPPQIDSSVLDPPMSRSTNGTAAAPSRNSAPSIVYPASSSPAITRMPRPSRALKPRTRSPASTAWRQIPVAAAAIRVAPKSRTVRAKSASVASVRTIAASSSRRVTVSKPPDGRTIRDSR
jgi:hypothetical protein